MKSVFVKIHLFIIGFLLTLGLQAQDVTRYENFEVKDGELYWRQIYTYTGSTDSLRRAVVQLLKSKSFTQNVIRNEAGYNGEILHFHLDCKRYDRKYINTPRKYWEGEWSGKFVVEIKDNRYRVTIYGLYYEVDEPAGNYRNPRGSLKGKYINAVTQKNQDFLRKSEFHNLALMSLSLKDEFDIKNLRPVSPNDW
jgi:hypothetical protein